MPLKPSCRDRDERYIYCTSAWKVVSDVSNSSTSSDICSWLGQKSLTHTHTQKLLILEGFMMSFLILTSCQIVLIATSPTGPSAPGRSLWQPLGSGGSVVSPNSGQTPQSCPSPNRTCPDCTARLRLYSELQNLVLSWNKTIIFRNILVQQIKPQRGFGGGG